MEPTLRDEDPKDVVQEGTTEKHGAHLNIQVQMQISWHTQINQQQRGNITEKLPTKLLLLQFSQVHKGLHIYHIRICM